MQNDRRRIRLLSEGRMAHARRREQDVILLQKDILCSTAVFLHPCCALLEYFPVDNTVDPIDRLSPELRADPFWVKRAQTEKLYTDFYVGDADPADPLCSPLKADETALAAFPDFLILSAGEDSLRNDTEAFALRLIKAGICVTAQRIPEAMHGFTTNRTPGWERALEAHCKFFRQHL